MPASVDGPLGLVLQWGRSGEGAEDRGAGCAATASAAGFNGAAPVKERKTIRMADGETPAVGASMGPLR